MWKYKGNMKSNFMTKTVGKTGAAGKKLKFKM